MSDFPLSPETARVTGSWSNDQELIALCMDMLGDVPGDTLDERVERLVSYHLELQLMCSELRGYAQTAQQPVAWCLPERDGTFSFTTKPHVADAWRRAGDQVQALFAGADTSTDRGGE